MSETKHRKEVGAGRDTKIFQLWWRTQKNIFQSQEEVEPKRDGTQTPFPPPVLFRDAAGVYHIFLGIGVGTVFH